MVRSKSSTAVLKTFPGGAIAPKPLNRDLGHARKGAIANSADLCSSGTVVCCQGAWSTSKAPTGLASPIAWGVARGGCRLESENFPKLRTSERIIEHTGATDKAGRLHQCTGVAGDFVVGDSTEGERYASRLEPRRGP
jgi:hypothetical protein